MKNILTILLFFSIIFNLNVSAAKLTINVKNLKNSNGKVLVGIYNKEDGFRDKNSTYKNATVNAVSGETVVVILNIEIGKYAISVFHDENNNGELDLGLFGIPKEIYGFSNNARGSFGPPSFSDCLFEIKGDTSITIYLK